MKQDSIIAIIQEQVIRSLWEINNVITCIDDDLWNKEYAHMPLYKHVYHTLHSLDLWLINPRDSSYQEPSIHTEHLNNLDVVTSQSLSKEDIHHYFLDIEKKIQDYLMNLKADDLLCYPENCEYTRLTLIIGQLKHLHTHMGMLMGFMIQDQDIWPVTLGLEKDMPDGKGPYYE